MHRSLLFLAVLVACSVAIPTLLKSDHETSLPLLANDGIETYSKETGLTTRGDTSVGMYDDELHKRWLTLFITAVAVFNTIPSGVSLAFGLYSLGRSVYSIYDDCHEPSSTKDKVDCLFSCLDLVLAAFVGAYKFNSGISRASEGLHTMAIYNSESLPSIAMHAHLAPVNESLAQASIRSDNNGTWARHATVYAGDLATHHLMYRQAHESDLGFDNDGSYHQYRLQPTTELLARLGQSNRSSFGKREEDSSYGLVADYLWKNEKKEVWQDFHDYSFGSGATIANWMENNNAEVTCAVPVETVSSHGGSTPIYGDQGVIAYGWNDKPYNFNGRAGTWVGECGGP